MSSDHKYINYEIYNFFHIGTYKVKQNSFVQIVQVLIYDNYELSIFICHMQEVSHIFDIYKVKQN